MIKSEEIEKVYELVKDVEGIELTHAFAIEGSGYSEDFEIICGESEKGKFELYYCEDMFVFGVEFPDGEYTHWHPWEVEGAVNEIKKFLKKPNDIIENLFAFDLLDNGIFPHPTENSDIFMIFENSYEKKTKDNFAKDLIATGCKNFTFCGKDSFEWENAFDKADIAFRGDTEEVAFTSVEDIFDDFIADVYETAINSNENVFLFYDNRKIYEKVKNLLQN